MKGLLIKDILSLKRYKTTYTALFVFYVVFSIATKNLDFLNGMILMISLFITIGTFSMDDYYKWDKYAVSLPVSRQKIVTAKYLLAIILVSVSTSLTILINSICFLCGMIEDISSALFAIYLLFCIAILVLLVLLPIFFKFGTEKSRIFMMIIFGFVMLAVYMAAKMGAAFPADELLEKIAFLSPVILIIFYYLSYKISVKIYKAKQF